MNIILCIILEQPYNGIYQMSGDEYNGIVKISSIIVKETIGVGVNEKAVLKFNLYGK